MLQRGAILSGKYRVESVLGEGGMAVVYAVTHLRNTARLAVKVLHADSVRKGHIRARFVREGKVANSVKHPGAVQMIDDGVAEDGSPYLVMEHLDGVCVGDIGSSTVPLAGALNIAYQVLDVLRAAHANGIIHRDIKPANLFVLRDGRVKVLDFGISRLHDGGEPFDSVATGAVMGTPFFMAPEQARADTRAIDTRTDVFGVGATLFTLISGKYLYTGDESRQVMMQAATEPARSLGTVAPGTPQAVVDLVAKAVAYDSAARWQSAEAMQDAVRELHERLFGSIAFEALATLVLVREFRRKSHAKLTSQLGARAWASPRVELSPLSTTLPALAAETRSHDSFGPPRNAPANAEAPSSRLSAGPAELAGWTGQVPAKQSSVSTPTARSGSRFGARFDKPGVARIALIASGICAAIFGFARYQTQPTLAAAKSPVTPDVQLQALVSVAEPTVNATITGVAEATPPTAQRVAITARPALALPSVKGSASPKPLAEPSPAPTTALIATAERLKVSPTLIRSRDHSAR